MENDHASTHSCTDFEEKTVKVRTPAGIVTDSVAYECCECTRMFVSQDKAEILKKAKVDDDQNLRNNMEKTKMIPVNESVLIASNHAAKQVLQGEDMEPLISELTESGLVDEILMNQNNSALNSEATESDSITKKTEVRDKSSTFSCKICSNTVLFASLSSIMHHYRDVHSMECTAEDLVAYNCYVCSKIFTEKTDLDRHLATECGKTDQTESAQSGEICNVCGMEVNSRCKCSQLPKIDVDIFECTLCESSFPQQHLLIEHHRDKHMGEKVYKCNHCEAKFSWHENLERHVKIHEDETKPGGSVDKESNRQIYCKVCSNPFHSVVSLSSHMSLSHPNHPFTLDGTWGVKDHLAEWKKKERHVKPTAAQSSIKLVHEPDEDLSEFVSELANSTMTAIKRKAESDLGGPPTKMTPTSKSSEQSDVFELQDITGGSDTMIIEEEVDIGVHKLVNAVAAQNNPDSLYCNMCDKTYQDMPDSSTSMNLRCTHCGWTFQKAYQLQAHLEHLHADYILLSNCRLCKVSLKNNTAMDRHYSQVHPDSRVFHCYHCDSQFNTKSCLRGHLLRHQSSKAGKGSGEHVCPHCSMRYAHAHQLLTHVTKSHAAFVSKPGVIGDLNTMFICGFCSKKFSYEGSLKIHLQQHEDKIKAQMLAAGMT